MKVSCLSHLHERYTYWGMIKILFAAPVILTGRAEVGHSLTDLRRFNYNIKFKQRMFLLSCGVITWIGLSLGLVKVGENIKMKEIEKVDISEWENNRIVIYQEQ